MVAPFGSIQSKWRMFVRHADGHASMSPAIKTAICIAVKDRIVALAARLFVSLRSSEQQKIALRHERVFLAPNSKNSHEYMGRVIICWKCKEPIYFSERKGKPELYDSTVL